MIHTLAREIKLERTCVLANLLEIYFIMSWGTLKMFPSKGKDHHACKGIDP